MIANSTSGDPAITSIQAFVHAGQLREGRKRPGPPDFSAEKNYSLRPTDIAAVSGQKAQLFHWRSSREIEPLHKPFCLEWKKEKTAAAKDSIESSGGSGAGATSAIV